MDEEVLKPDIPQEEAGPAAEQAPPKPKRTRKKKAEEAPLPAPEDSAPTPPEAEPPGPARAQPKPAPILTVDAGAEVQTQESREDAVWHSIQNAYRTRRVLSGILGGIEQTDGGKTVIIVDYKGFRVVIPLKEMAVDRPGDLSGRAYTEWVTQRQKHLSAILGCEIDFIIMGIDPKSRSIAASRREAMLKKRRMFYLEPDENGACRVYAGRVVQARVLSVAEKLLRVEIFGVECTIFARDLSWEWIGDARDRYSVGDQILVRILSVAGDSPETLSVKADAKSVAGNRPNNLGLCRVQSKYAGQVTDVYKGVVYVRLANGVNAIAHSCYDRRTPGKKDDVSFAVTGLDEERGIALGIITRIIRQNL